ncbi:hypothetical protein ACFQ6U_12920 [Streptomyces sp. NPDC056465]|uniref:hypothetical protein n=1 Tax=Streptomyces sp. NPDC056465 TaxID=3345829 RepID=UPI0036C30643
MSTDLRPPVPLAARPEPEPRGWAAPLTGTVAAPALSAAVSSAENAFADRTFLLAGGLLLSYALILPSWFPARRQRRNGLVLSGCAVAALSLAMISTLGWAVSLVALLTGHIDG